MTEIKLPIDVLSERWCLGAALNRRECMLDLLRMTTVDMFQSPINKMIFNSIEKCYEEDVPVNKDSVAQCVIRNYCPVGLDIDVCDLLYSYAMDGFSCYVKLQAKNLIDCYRRREVMVSCLGEIEKLSTTTEDPRIAILEISKKMNSLLMDYRVEPASGDVIIKDMFDGESLMDRIENPSPKMRGYSTGFYGLDTNMGGLVPTRFIVIGARAGIGKTEFLCQLVVKLITNGVKCLVVSLEMSQCEYMQRIMGIFLKKNHSLLERGEHSTQFIEQSRNTIINSEKYLRNLYIVEAAGLKATDLELLVEQNIESNDVKLVFLDHLGLMAPADHKMSRYEAVSRNSNSMKMIAMRYNICLVSAVQLNRGLENRQDHTPMLSDLRDSGDIEQDANQVILLSRNDEKSTIKADIRKNRHGDSTIVNFNYDNLTQTMEEGKWS